jgi:hypothetical protein
VIEGDQGLGDGPAGGAVVSGRGGQREQALGNSCRHIRARAAAVQLQAQLALEAHSTGVESTTCIASVHESMSPAGPCRSRTGQAGR